MDMAVYPTNSIGLLFGTQEVWIPGDPAVGSGFSYALPGGYYHRLKTLTFTLTTSAVVANRFIGIRLTDSGSSYLIIRCSTAVTASQTIVFSYAAGFGIGQGAQTQGVINMELPELWIAPGHLLASSSLAFQVGDAITNVVALVERIERDKLIAHYDASKLDADTSMALASPYNR